jgi:ABC-type multidrug transport system permease subunit
MITAIRSELVLLNRPRMWAIAGLVTVAFAAVATSLLIITAPSAADGVGLAGSGDGMPVELLRGPGGATAAVSWATFGFGFVLLLAAFTSRIGNEFASGTFRTALLHHPNRWSLIGGKMAALIGVTIALVVLGFATGAVTAALVAPTQDIDTAGWFGAEALRHTGADLLRTIGWATGWALIATALAVLVRSVPIALGAGIFWFGPIENVVGEGQAFAQRWFPGLLLQQVVSPAVGQVVSTGVAAATLAAYGVALVLVIMAFFRRLDVTS